MFTCFYLCCQRNSTFFLLVVKFRLIKCKLLSCNTNSPYFKQSFINLFISFHACIITGIKSICLTFKDNIPQFLLNITYSLSFLNYLNQKNGVTIKLFQSIFKIVVKDMHNTYMKKFGHIYSGTKHFILQKCFVTRKVYHIKLRSLIQFTLFHTIANVQNVNKLYNAKIMEL